MLLRLLLELLKISLNKVLKSHQYQKGGREYKSSEDIDVLFRDNDFSAALGKATLNRTPLTVLTGFISRTLDLALAACDTAVSMLVTQAFSTQTIKKGHSTHLPFVWVFAAPSGCLIPSSLP